MTTSIPPSQPSQTTPSPLPPIASARTPTGIGSQPITLTPPSASSNSCFRCFQSIRNFFRSGCLTVLKYLNGFIDLLKSCLQNEPDPIETLPNAWMIPQQQPQPSAPPPLPEENSSQVPVANPFSSLPITPDEMRKIFQIVHRLGTTSPIFLLPHRATLEQLGREIEHVHPLKFLEYILLHSTLRTDLDAIRSNSWIWPQFLQGLSRKLERERGPLASMLPGFARSLQIDPALIEPLLNSGQWERMVFLLLDIKLGRISPSPMAAPPTIVPAAPPTIVPAAPSPEPAAEPQVGAEPPVEPPQPAAPQPTPWQQIALSDEHRTMIADLVRAHRNMGYWSVSWGNRHASSLWDRLDRAHPLCILVHIFTTPEVMADLKALWPYQLHRRYLVLELSALLEHKPWEDYLPYIGDFSRAVQQEEPIVVAHVHFRKWRELIEILKESSMH